MNECFDGKAKCVSCSFLFSLLVNSCSSTGGKYDIDLLKSDVHHAKARVQRLKRELANIDSEMLYKWRGVETLAQ